MKLIKVIKFIKLINLISLLSFVCCNFITVMKFSKIIYFSTAEISETSFLHSRPRLTRISLTRQDWDQDWKSFSLKSHPWSNKRTELAVKHAKSLVQDCLGQGPYLGTDCMSPKSRQLLPLQLFDTVDVHDERANTPKWWSKTGKIMEILGNDSYLIKIYRITKQNRQYLCRNDP